MVDSMRAVVVRSPGPPETLELATVAVPRPAPGQVLIGVEAFGLNRSELHFRRGQASFGSFPRIPGIEATGRVVECPGGELAVGAQVAGSWVGWAARSTAATPNTPAHR